MLPRLDYASYAEERDQIKITKTKRRKHCRYRKFGIAQCSHSESGKHKPESSSIS